MFSVIIPYYNKSAYIIRCIDSVLNQTFSKFEIILVDDGSTDNGIELVNKKYGQRIRIYSQKNQGVSAARNKGIENATFDYIALLDADDCWHPQYLESMNWIISNEKEIKIIGAHYSRINDFFERKYDLSHYFKFDNYFGEAIRNTYFTSSSSVIKKSFFEENDGFNSLLKKGEDIDVWFRVIQSGGNAFYITNTLVYYSDEDVNQTTKNTVNLEDDLVGNTNELYKKLMSSGENKDFNMFVSKYVYFNLYPYFFDSECKAKAKAILKENQHYFFGLELIYLMPYFLGQKLMQSKKGALFIRLYLKFIIRYTLK